MASIADYGGGGAHLSSGSGLCGPPTWSRPWWALSVCIAGGDGTIVAATVPGEWP